ncbi:MAG: hypothetical protein HYV40_05570 [Candidatus Levybacteria bacterium]|nr:hypothetical protein [Candidatus Levybacteria bacterium]
MNFIAQLLRNHTAEKKTRRKTFADYQHELLLRQGREQFRKLVKQGLSIPVVYL